MAVPKKRKSSSRTRMGRANKKLKKYGGSINGRSHHIDADGFYNGRQVLVPKVKQDQ